MLQLTEKEYQNLKKKINSKSGDNTNESATKKEAKMSKYRNVHTYIYEDGTTSSLNNLSGHGPIIHHFDSKKEYERWIILLALEKSGVISNLKKQVPLLIQEKFISNQGIKINPITYIADFLYTENEKIVVEDVKGIDSRTGKAICTEAFNLKWKLLQYRYPKYLFKII